MKTSTTSPSRGFWTCGGAPSTGDLPPMSGSAATISVGARTPSPSREGQSITKEISAGKIARRAVSLTHVSPPGLLTSDTILQSWDYTFQCYADVFEYGLMLLSDAYFRGCLCYLGE